MSTPTRFDWDTKIAVVLRDDLQDWQKLNVTAFTTSGIAGTVPDVVGEPYTDKDGNTYLPMFRQPVLVFSVDAERMKTIHQRALRRDVIMAVYPQAIFATNNDEDNRATIADVPADQLVLAGIAVRGDRREVDKVVRGAVMHS
ncbi:DUF2000 domain-containing protein [Streptomyces somaliensis]|uniref:DUF2000 domain-containing protein n=1 Tax=Streptomyces somaliensis TaxID=78355 RepID=UPI0020CF4E3C|nr:DUF2000 domain-containing protein [Streptomyces somaliensis]MCP9943861.1 DUF2000 domain-containing protein [Streptomyces somaliensis]MCP9962892.1 DUF2000 domain-containing protein [Streptomyces somaliensis]MCP9975740.1 DUF2000 domain-containing protein [Streptomyces somaliensis]